MYRDFTDRARKVMQLADLEAQRLNHEYVGTEHILLGLIATETGVAQVVLRNLGIDLTRIRRGIEKTIVRGPVVTLGKPPQTPRAKKTLEFAIEEARGLNHDYVGTEHLLLGLMRENEGVAAQVLRHLGLDIQAARQEVLNLLGQNVTSESDHGATESAKLAEDPAAAIQHLPDHAREIVKLFERQIELIREEKEEFVATQEWEQAASLRDILEMLKKLRADFITGWPRES